MLLSILTIEEARKMFAYFLKEIGVEVKFKKTDYGYRTYDNQWKIFINQKKIVRHRNIRVWETYEYVNKLEELSFMLSKETDCIRATPMSEVVYYG